MNTTHLLTTKYGKLEGEESSLSYSSPSVDVSKKVTLAVGLFPDVSPVSTAAFLPFVPTVGGNDYVHKPYRRA